MDILHTAVTVVIFSRESKPRLHFLVPQRRDVIHFDFAVNQRTFDFIPQHHVRRIAHFVRIDANIARLHALVPGNKVLFTERRLAAKASMHRRKQMFQEGIAATQLHLKEQALRFVNSS
ncbi:hypothetical protein D3C76_1460430 [compost metagenome]